MRSIKNIKRLLVLDNFVFVTLLMVLVIAGAFENNNRLFIKERIEERYDSPIGLVFQLDREFLRLTSAIKLATASHDPIDQENLKLRLDILYSRLDLVSKSPSILEAFAELNVKILIDKITTQCNILDNILAAPKINRNELYIALLRLEKLQQPIQDLTFKANIKVLASTENQLNFLLNQVNLNIVLLCTQAILIVFGFTHFKKRQIQLRKINASLKTVVLERTTAKLEAEAANRSKSRFLAAASHDLRQPMAALSLYSGMMSAALKPGNHRLMSNIQNCVDGLSDLLNDLFEVAKLDSGLIESKINILSLDDLCKSMWANYSAIATEKGLSLRWRYKPGLMLQTDPQLFRRLLSNLIDNALKYTNHGGVLVATRRRGGKLWIEVWDTGIGIQEKYLTHIFEEFSQLGDAARNNGNGLGLSIVRKISKLLDLEIHVKSSTGRGSMFAIELPACEARVSWPIPLQVTTSIFTIGIVEDNRLALSALTATLQSLGHIVFSGTTVTEALGQIRQEVPDIVIADYRLEYGQTGVDVIASFRERYGKELPAIILTGETDTDLPHNLGMMFKTIPSNT